MPKVLILNEDQIDKIQSALSIIKVWNDKISNDKASQSVQVAQSMISNIMDKAKDYKSDSAMIQFIDKLICVELFQTDAVISNNSIAFSSVTTYEQGERILEKIKFFEEYKRLLENIKTDLLSALCFHTEPSPISKKEENNYVQQSNTYN